MKRSNLLAGTILLAFTTPAFAETAANSPILAASAALATSTDNRLDTITVIGATATADATLGGIPLDQLPVSSHVVSREEIDRLHFVDPDELLDRIPGETQVRNLRIPNGGKSYTVPLVDGVPLASPYRGATQDITTVNSFDIERIEIIKGPSSALYPNNAFGGIINVITREAPKDFEARVWGEVGDFARQRFGASAAGSAGDFGFFVDGNTQNLNGLRETYRNDRDQFSSKITYHPNDQTKAFLRYEHLEREEVFPGDLRASEFFEDPTQIGRTAGSNEDTISNSLTFKLAQGIGEAGTLDAIIVKRIEKAQSDSRFGPPQETEDNSLHMKLSYRHMLDNSNIIVGMERFDGNEDADNYASTDVNLEGAIQSISNSDLVISSYFAQYQIRPLTPLELTFGVRHEKVDLTSSFPMNDPDKQIYSKSFSDTSPKFGITYDLNENNRLWFGASQGFLAPGLDDLFLDDGHNPNLKPEKATNIELGIRGEYGPLSYNTAYYNTKVDNYLVTEDDGVTETISNAGQVTVQGVETVLEYRVSDYWRIGATHTYSKNIYDTFFGPDDDGDNNLSGNTISRSPLHHLNARLALLPIEDLIVELEGDFYSGYPTRDDNSIDPEGKFKRDERLNLRVSYHIGKWEIWAHGLNLTDTLEDRVSYTPPSRRGAGRRNYRIVDGRTFYMGIARNF